MIMKSRSSYGATLLEVMLVLAVAAMVIVMSIRYYRNATNAQNVNLIMSQIQAITAAADAYVQGQAGDYSALANSSISDIVGDDGLTTAYGTAITVAGTGNTTYTVSFAGMPKAVCSSLAAQIIANSKIAITSACSASGAMTYTYTSTD